MSLPARREAGPLMPLCDRHLSERPISLAMRLALGFLHAGALFRHADGFWESRQFPDERVRDATVRALIERGGAIRQDYAGLYGVVRSCVTLGPQGRSLYRDGVRAQAKAMPPAAEAVLREVEQALGQLDREARQLGAALAAIEETRLSVRSQLAESEARITRIETRLGKLEATRRSLDARRVDLRCLVVEAGERMMAAITEGRS